MSEVKYLPSQPLSASIDATNTSPTEAPIATSQVNTQPSQPFQLSLTQQQKSSTKPPKAILSPSSISIPTRLKCVKKKMKLRKIQANVAAKVVQESDDSDESYKLVTNIRKKCNSDLVYD